MRVASSSFYFSFFYFSLTRIAKYIRPSPVYPLSLEIFHPFRSLYLKVDSQSDLPTVERTSYCIK